MQGYIKLYRKMMHSPIWQEPNYLKLWLYCLMKASHKEHELLVGNQLVKLLPGEFVTGRKALAKDLNMGVKPSHQHSDLSWWRYLNNLENWGMLTIKKTNKFSVISIIKWSEYQETEQQVSNKQKTANQDEPAKEKRPYSEIIKYLNEKTGKKFSSKSEANKKLINGRFAEGRTIEDFKHVIDVKCQQWLNNPDMSKYLRPETLFSAKNFEKYVNENLIKKTQLVDPRDKEIQFQRWQSEGNDPNEFDWGG